MGDVLGRKAQIARWLDGVHFSWAVRDDVRLSTRSPPHTKSALEHLYGVPVWSPASFGEGLGVDDRGLNYLCLFLHSVEIEESGALSFPRAGPHYSFHQPCGYFQDVFLLSCGWMFIPK